MKTRLMLILGIAIFLFTNCTKSEIDTPFTTAVAVANMESDAVKSSATDEGYFTWANGDAIGIFTSKNTQLKGTLNSGAGTASGSFQYSFVGNEPELTGFALYPYNEGHKIENGNLTFVMPASYDLGETLANTNSPMIATPTQRTGTANFDFAHLGGLFRFVINNAPVGANKFTLSLGGKKINGKFEVSLSADVLQLATDQGDNSNSVTTLKFEALKSVQNITLFVPVPVGEYTGITAKLYAGDEELGSWGSDDAKNDVSRKSLKLMSAITFSNAGGNIDNEIPVGSAGQLESAVQNDGLVLLTEPITLTKHINVPAGVNTTIDLQGQSLNNGEFSIVVGEGATLNILNNAALVKSASDAVIRGSGDIITAGKDAVINIAEGVNIESTNNCCIFIPNGAENVNVTTAGNLLTSGGNYSAIYVNGNVKTGTINITGGEIEHSSDVAVYIAGNVNVNISGNTAIKGTTAIEQRAGNLTIDGGTFTATAESFTEVVNNNGSTTTGVAVAVCQHNTNHDTQAIINGGSFTGAKSVFVKPFGDNTNVSMEVKGGTFSDLLAIGHADDGAEIKLSADVSLNDILVIDKSITLDGNNHKLTSSAARAINVSGADDVTIKNLEIECSGERGINVIQKTKKVTIESVKAKAANYVLNLASSASKVVVVVNNSTFTGLNAVNIGASYADVTIEESSITTVDNNENEGYSTIALNKDAEYAKVIVTNSTINITGSAATDSRKASIGAEGCYISINGSTDVAESHVACIEYGDYYYGFTEIGHALNKAVAGETIKLLRDVTITEKITIDKSITLDGNGKTLSYTGSNRVIDVPAESNGADVTIKNLTIDCKSDYCQRGVNYNTTGDLTLNNVIIKGKNVTYALNLPGSSIGADVSIINSSLTANIALNIWGKDSKVIAENSNFTSVDSATHENYSAIALNCDGSTSAEGAQVCVNGGAITARDENGKPSNALSNSTTTGTINVSESTVVIGEMTKPVAIVNYGTSQFYSCTTLQSAIDKAIETNAVSVRLINNVTLTESLNIVKEASVTLDLNGKTISQEKACTENYQMIYNKGDLTITGNGKISFTDSGEGDPNFRWGSYTIRNEGKLVVENGTIEHLGQQNTNSSVKHMYCAIFQYSGETIINGGTISTPTYRSMRLWHGDMTINNGYFVGQLWVQAQKANTAKLSIKGGEFQPKGVDGSSVFVENSDYVVNFEVSGGIFNTKIGCSDANKEGVKGSVSGGKFTSDARNKTNDALLKEGYSFVQRGDMFEVVKTN